MGIHFKILDSTDAAAIGNIYEVLSGHIIGRSKGNIILDDERISSVHAEIQMNNQGELFLVDKDSRNGIKVQGKRITKLLITPGTVFQIGNTLVEVILKQSKPKAVSSEVSQDNLIWQARSLIESIESKPTPVTEVIFFTAPVRLNVIQGLQLDQKWDVQYGPFKFGSGCVGGLLAGKNIPLEVFEIIESRSGIMVRPLTKERILSLNSIPIISECLIENGDVLSIETDSLTRIKFEI